MISIQYNMISITLWEYVYTSVYEYWAWFIWNTTYCASIYMCTTLHYARQAAYPRGSHQFQFQLSLWVAHLVTTRGLGTYCPQGLIVHRGILPTVCAYSFFCLQDSDQSGMIVMWALGQSCIPAFYYSLCTLHVYECNQLYQIYFSVSIKSCI